MNVLVFDVLDYWHAGAGHGAGRYLDATVIRTPAGLPYLPGRTVKGILRKAVQQCEDLGHLDAGTTEILFGSPIGTGRFSTQAGQLQLGSAVLEGAWEKYAAGEEGRALLPAFFDSQASTALEKDEDALAKPGSLRRIEVAIPVRLLASWDVEDGEYQALAAKALKMAAPLVRAVGGGANRGLGRVDVQVKTGFEKQGEVAG